MDLSGRRKPLAPSERIEIARFLQLAMLDAIAADAHDMTGRLVFHGGTAISMVHGSPRWSEDLDFVVSPEMSAELDAIREDVGRIAGNRVDEMAPGSSFELMDKGRAKTGIREADPGTVMRWVGRWSHPARLHVVKVKVEFYVAQPEVVAFYDTREANPAFAGIETDRAIPAATLRGIWADKIMAISGRPATKWRDVFDMGFVMKNMGDVGDDVLASRLDVAALTYRATPASVLAGLERDQVCDLWDQYEQFEADMKGSWLPEAHAQHDLKAYHAACLAQIDRARGMLGRMLEARQDTEDFQCDW